jgi:hypothetical protein
MIVFIKNLINTLLKKFNYQIVKKKNSIKIIEANDCYLSLMNKVIKISVTSTERQWSLIQSLEYINNNKIEGNLVECGVFRGGNLILMNHICNKLNLKKDIYAYDTFSGMTTPTDEDVEIETNISANKIMNKTQKNKYKGNNIWCFATIEQVKSNLSKEFKTFENIKFVKGPVEETLLNVNNLPDKISLLRLDTDFYSSTKIELEILYPRLVKGGILIIDDYGSWEGSRKAVDEYFKNENIWLHYIDKDSRLLIK